MKSNLKVVQRWYTTLDKSIMHPDVVWELPEGYPGGGNYYGIDEVFNIYLPKLPSHFDSWTAEANKLFDAGDAIIGLGNYRGRIKGSQEEFLVPFIHIWWVQDGQIVKAQAQTDTLLLHQYINRAND